jgi:hypothetical protein
MKTETQPTTYTVVKKENGVIFINSDSYDLDPQERTLSTAFISPKRPGVIQVKGSWQISHERARRFIERLKEGGGVPEEATSFFFHCGQRTYDLEEA